MKHIDEIYKDWSGESPYTNYERKIHDSNDMTDFAQYYHKKMIEKQKEFIDYEIEAKRKDKNKNTSEWANAFVLAFIMSIIIAFIAKYFV